MRISKIQSRPAGPKSKIKRILVVDNDELILEFMNDVLSKEGYEVVTAKDGLSALNTLKRYTPDVIFVDLIMHKIDGKKLCRIIRGMERLKGSYIVILSATLAEEAISIPESRANAFIAKGPFEQMAQNILWVLDHPDEAHLRCLSGAVIGIKQVFPRRITMELLMVKKHFEVLLETLSMLDRAREPGEVVHLPFTWPGDPAKVKWHPPEPSPIIKLFMGDIKKALKKEGKKP